MSEIIANKPHVCLITTGNIEYTLGGEENFTLSFSKWLHSNGFAVTVLYNRLFDIVGVARNLPDNTSKTVGGRIQIGAPYFLYQFYLFTFSFVCVLRILSINKQGRLSIIHAQDTRHSGLSAVIAGWITRIPVVVHSHGHAIESFDSLLMDYEGIKRFYMLFMRAMVVVTHNITVNRASALIAVSSSVKERLIDDESKAKTKTIVVPIGIKVADHENAMTGRASVRRKLQIDRDSLLIGFVGRLEYEKNVTALIKAFETLERKDSKAKLLIVGDGNLKNALKKLVDKLGLSSSVIFTGFRSDIPALLSAIDIFVLPSYVEGCPTALLEAMASGRTVVASSLPSVKEIIVDHENGLLFNPARTSQLEKILLLLDEDSKLREYLMSKAYLTSLQYDQETLYKRILNLYVTLSARALETKKCRQEFL